MLISVRCSADAGSAAIMAEDSKGSKFSQTILDRSEVSIPKMSSIVPLSRIILSYSPQDSETLTYRTVRQQAISIEDYPVLQPTGQQDNGL
jgi:hypothetical protein